MTETIVLFLDAAGAGSRWLRIANGAIVARGEGLPPRPPADDETALVAIAPAAAVTLHWAELPDRSPAQAVAAARLLVAEASATPLAALHVAVGDEGVAARPIAVVATAEMDRWLATLATDGFAPQAMIPAALLLPRPEAGYVRADLAGETVVRSDNAAFADDPVLTPLVVGDEQIETLSGDGVEAAIVGAIATPPLDLRQGPYARRRRRSIDWALVRRLGWLAATTLLVTFSISVVKIVRLDLAIASLDAEADTLARTGLPAGETVSDAGRQLATRLARARGAGAGFSRTAAAVFSAVRAVPGTVVTGLSFDATGALRVSVTAPGEGAVAELGNRVRGYGFQVMPGSLVSGVGGKVSGELTVTAS